jgi:hypothetical protein
MMLAQRCQVQNSSAGLVHAKERILLLSMAGKPFAAHT